ncbi:MAG: hypothetical protein ACJ8GN_12125 [Longimicrobiaceae bacterium]
MLILDIPRPFESDLVRVPLYHRGPLSLFPEATVSICLLPGKREQDALPELVISPIDFEFWDDLWRITMAMHERVGLVHDVFETLKDHDVNVLAAESSSMDGQQYHSVEMVVDASLYNGAAHDNDKEYRTAGKTETLLDLRRAILANVFKDIALSSSGEPRIKIRRVRSLFNAHRHFLKAAADYRRGVAFQPVVAQTRVEKVDGKVVLRLSGEIREVLKEALDLQQESTDPRGAYYLPVSETDDRFLRVYFIRNSRPVLSLTIAHEERPGALAAITEAMHEAKFDILTSLSRLHKFGKHATFDLVVKPPLELGTDIDLIKDTLETALSTQELVNSFNIKVAYPLFPQTYSAIEHKSLSVQPGARTPERPRKRPTHTLLQEHYTAYADLSRRVNPTFEELQRFALARDLIAEETIANGHEAAPRSLFVSYSFRDDSRFKTINDIATELGMEIVTGRKLGRGVNRDRIVHLMRTCTDFLGIWTEDGGQKFKDGWWPSPWLHLELGAALSLGLPWHLLISKKVHEDAWRRVAADEVHTFFDTGDFEAQAREALTEIANGPRNVDVPNGHMPWRMRVP